MAALPSGLIIGLDAGRLLDAIDEAHAGRPQRLATIREPEDVFRFIELVRWRLREPGEPPDPTPIVPGSDQPPPERIAEPTGITLDTLHEELVLFSDDDRLALPEIMYSQRAQEFYAWALQLAVDTQARLAGRTEA